MKTKLVRSFEFVVHRKKTTHYLLPFRANPQGEPATHSRQRRTGFTLIELLVSITIIAILIGAGTYTWINGQEKGRDGKRKNEIKEVQKSLELYAHLYGKYPNTASGSIQCNAGTDTTTLSWGSEFICDNTTFMQKLPKDPKTTNPQYYYEYGTSGDTGTYKISAAMENAIDPETLPANRPCTPNSTSYNYCIQNP